MAQQLLQVKQTFEQIFHVQNTMAKCLKHLEGKDCESACYPACCPDLFMSTEAIPKLYAALLGMGKYRISLAFQHQNYGYL